MKKSLLTVAALALIVGKSSAGEPRGIQVYAFEEDFPAIYIDCLGETIHRTVSGEGRFHVFETATGAVHVIDNWRFTVYDVGNITGRIWVGYGNAPYQSNARLAEGSVEQWISRIQMKPLDEGSPMWMWENQFKMTVNANGEIVVVHETDDHSYEGSRCLPTH